MAHAVQDPGGERGQAGVEWLALALAVVALVAAVGIGLRRPELIAGVRGAVADALRLGDRDRPAGVSASEWSYVLAAVDGASDGSAPSVGDALARLEDRLGAVAARRLVERAAVDRFPRTHRGHLGGRFGITLHGRWLEHGPEVVDGSQRAIRPDLWDSEERRREGRATAHVVSSDEERRLLAAIQAEDTRQLRSDRYSSWGRASSSV